MTNVITAPVADCYHHEHSKEYEGREPGTEPGSHNLRIFAALPIPLLEMIDAPAHEP